MKFHPRCVKYSTRSIISVPIFPVLTGITVQGKSNLKPYILYKAKHICSYISSTNRFTCMIYKYSTSPNSIFAVMYFCANRYDIFRQGNASFLHVSFSYWHIWDNLQGQRYLKLCFLYLQIWSTQTWSSKFVVTFPFLINIPEKLRRVTHICSYVSCTTLQMWDNLLEQTYLMLGFLY